MLDTVPACAITDASRIDRSASLYFTVTLLYQQGLPVGQMQFVQGDVVWRLLIVSVHLELDCDAVPT
jgi:hypothetical protein